MSRWVLTFQGIYYLLTGAWPLVHMTSFEFISGSKTDHWLVNTVGVLAIAMGLALLAGARRSPPSVETLVLSVASSLAFAGIDVVYVLNGTIARTYLLDTAAQAVMMAALAASLLAARRTASGHTR